MPLTWHSLFETTDGFVALGTIALAVGTVIVAIAALRSASKTRDLAIGTKELAEATARVARLTEEEVKAVTDQAKAARQEVQISRETLQASIRPRITDVPFGLGPPSKVATGGLSTLENDWGLVYTTETPEFAKYVVPVRNVGPGLAIIKTTAMRFYEPGLADPSIYYGVPTVTVVPPGERTQAVFTFDAGQVDRTAHFKDRGAFSIQVAYQDVSGEQLEMTRLDLEFKGGTNFGWRVTRLHFFTEDDDVPYASSGPGGPS